MRYSVLKSIFFASLVMTFLTSPSIAVKSAEEPPHEWIDEDTGHRIVRLSRREGSNSSFYFHQNPFTASGDKMIFAGTTSEGRRLFSIHFESGDIEQVTDRDSSFEIVGPLSRTVFYLSDGVVYRTHLDTKETIEITRLPEKWHSGRGFGLNSTETLLVGCYAEGEEAFYARPRSEWFVAIYEARLPNTIYTIDTGTGEITEVHSDNQWLGHVQFSPVDPGLIMFCHEGPWERVDRIWTIRTDGSELTLRHKRTQEREIAGHEFWGPDGEWIWFDLQQPAWQNIFLAGVHLESGALRKFPLEPAHWSYHYNVNADGTLFCGDGGDNLPRGEEQQNKWIYLYRPIEDHLEVTRLVNMANHDYRALEPNVMFTPDSKWVVFRSNMHGISHVYAVDVRSDKPDSD